jgi:hypothetical protein
MVFFCPLAKAQAALLVEQPYGFFGLLNPTGHNALYFARICAETPTKLRRCNSGELGVVISRYQGVNGYDWIAIPLVPYLYSVGNPLDVPSHVNHNTVVHLRNQYRKDHLRDLTANVPNGDLIHGGWSQLIGASYMRKIYAFRFNTTEKQDDDLIRKLNDAPNNSKFNLLFNNCADFSRVILNDYFPNNFHRTIFPDFGMTSPKLVTYHLEDFAKKHPQLKLTVFEIPQILGYRRRSHPIQGLFIDYLMLDRHNIIPSHLEPIGPSNLYEIYP